MQIEAFLQNFLKLPQDSITKLLTEVVLSNLDKAKNFSENETYNKGDIILYYSQSTGKHSLLTAKYDNIVGNFNTSQWDAFSVGSSSSSSSSAVITESIYTASADDETTCPIGQIFDKDSNSLLVSHSVRGLLNSSNYSINGVGTAINFINMVLYQGEKITFYVLKNQ